MKGAIDQGKLHINKAIYRKGELIFEIVVDPDLAVEYRNGNIKDIREVLKSQEIFSDAQKGNVASSGLLEATFSTSEPLKVAEEILKHGEIQLTSEYRQKLRDQKKNKIIELIHQNAINPQANAPHTRERLESAMDEAKVKVDEWKTAEDQVETVLKALQAILPIRYEIRIIEVIINSQYAPQSYAILKNYGTLEETQWLNDGGLLARIKMPAGMQEEFIEKLNNLTHGSVDVKVIEN